MFGKIKKIHFVGIGGIGMSGIAEVLHNLGYTVTGSDVSSNANTKRLSNLGINIFNEHRYDNAKDRDVIVYSSAVKTDNPEIMYAYDHYIPVIKRGEMLAELMRMKYSIVVAGSHGKTTTTSMVAEIFNHAKLDPTVIIGGRLNRNDNNAAVGKGEIMISEADESDRSFLILYPTVSVITNIDYEHMESYKDFDDVKMSFASFANRVPFYGVNVICLDDPNVADIIPLIEKRFITYGVKGRSDINAYNIMKNGFSVSFDVSIFGKEYGRVELSLPGEHNVLNSLAAIGVAQEFDIPFEAIKQALKNFGGVQRRLSIRYDSSNIKVIDDYGHHPTEISTTLRAVKDAFHEYKVVVIFQPHRYSRTKMLMNEFSKSFFDADELYITDIYAASEEPIEGVNAEKLVNEIKRRGFRDAHYLQNMKDFTEQLDKYSGKKTIILTLGAGSITNFSKEIAELLGVENV